MMGVLMALGWLLLTLLKIAGVLLLILLVLLALVLLCPLCADVCWEGGILTVRAGALGLTLPVCQWPAPEKPAGAEEPKGFWGKLKANSPNSSTSSRYSTWSCFCKASINRG